MSQRLIVLDEAEDELIEAEKWYERQRPGLGREFRAAIDEGMERLLKAPLAASPIVNVPAFIGARRIFVKWYPYSIVFIEQGEDLWVVAFAHHHRRPGYWRERLEP
ncbi:MAG: type II toxin-antitoxin system RelE/ParE family toxin [Deltaproteobacteria bacterium]|nr:type II toxin-antitoxin system RelE/ParE family toxin [Deltaproteobacteria bacterium]MBI2227562.1 type II toxin-antitoxin system RelE/ParE family toxin [Deltaproteobacteria bacterium]MBI2366851.1 type II toxin-antitoxin system RelE/ParE family toxin [Deltaproteobacteria bacterium]MBI2533971.1 type II toxin-antitoxin system RelE/ParE family toxin [Deltaproteobacteria bacterium]